MSVREAIESRTADNDNAGGKMAIVRSFLGEYRARNAAMKARASVGP